MPQPALMVARSRVENSRITGYSCAARTIFARSLAVETLAGERPVGSTKRVSVMSIAAALVFIASTNDSRPPG